MPEDASLDDFLTGTDDGEPASDDSRDDDGDEPMAEGADTEVDDAGEDAAGETTGAVEEAVDPATAAEATSTYGWSPDGVACEGCGATVDRRWRDDDRLVCTDCKEW